MSESREASCEALMSDTSEVERKAANPSSESAEASLTSTADLSLAWMARDTLPRLFVESSLSVVWLNACARRELALRQGIQLRNGVLATSNPSLQDKLLNLLREAGPLATASIRGANGEGHVIVHAHRLEIAGEEPLFGIKFFRIGQDFKPVYVGLDHAFGLTAGERRVMIRLVDGDSLPAVARSLGLSVETIRTHVRNIYAKTEVSSRAELFSLVRAFRL